MTRSCWRALATAIKPGAGALKQFSGRLCSGDDRRIERMIDARPKPRAIGL